MSVELTIALALTLAFGLLWGFATLRRNVSVVDVFWGPAFGLVAVLAARSGAAPLPRRVWVVGLVLAWGLRLGVHLYRRGRGAPEDRRYAAMRAKDPRRFPLESLASVFLLQAGLVFVISLPLVAALVSPALPALGPFEWVGGAVVVAGILIEATADRQLRRFLSDPASAGRVMDRGLWRYSRHPNYFGDALVWVGFGILGFPHGPVGAVLGPGLMIVLLLRVSGVSLLERTIRDRRPEYAEYVRRTSAFVPWPPRRASD